ncbi:MAG: Gfo/Idh/MocA family protein [Dermatophilaceae bacterium]|nr:Gfo/Idh/MocA family oxidoreductase [Intrasporangiaceae bacterium]
MTSRRETTERETSGRETSGRELRVGVVGAGIMGADHIRRIDRITAGARVAAVIEPDEGRRDAARAGLAGAAGYARLGDAVADARLDAVVIASPGRFHEPDLLACIEARLPTLCEKPMTPDAAAARRVVDAEQRLDRPHLQVGFMRRFDRDYLALRDVVRTGRAGELLMVHAVHRNAAAPDTYRAEMLINDSVVHEFDVVPWLAGSDLATVEVRHARANSTSPAGIREPILVLMTLQNGVLVDVEMSVSAHFGYQVATELVCERGVARGGQPQGVQVWIDGEFRIGEHRHYTTRFADAYDRQMQSWVDAVRDGLTSGGSLVDGPDAWDGYKVALACEAGVRALSGGVHDVEIPPTPDFYR